MLIRLRNGPYVNPAFVASIEVAEPARIGLPVEWCVVVATTATLQSHSAHFVRCESREDAESYAAELAAGMGGLGPPGPRWGANPMKEKKPPRAVDPEIADRIVEMLSGGDVEWAFVASGMPGELITVSNLASTDDVNFLLAAAIEANLRPEESP